MKIYTLHKKQQLPISLDKAWEFLSNPKNLSIITPDYMSFNILSKIDRPLYTGQIIQYNVTPLLGIKTKWISEITHIEEKKYSVNAGKGWLGITDKYWITSLIPEKNKEFKADFEFKNKFKANFIETKPTSVGANEIKSKYGSKSIFNFRRLFI